MKELSIEEVLRIAGGLPVPAALDEVTYLAPGASTADPIDYARLLDSATRSPEAA